MIFVPVRRAEFGQGARIFFDALLLREYSDLFALPDFVKGKDMYIFFCF